MTYGDMASSETPRQGRQYCPACEPEADVLAEILDVRWCDAHRPAPAGDADEQVQSNNYMSGSAEAGGEDNRRWCEVIHRPK